MMGVPPICQSPLGNGGESKGAGGMRRGGGEAPGAGAVQAGVCESCANALSNRCPNQLSSVCALAVVINTKIAQAHREPPRHARPTL